MSKHTLFAVERDAWKIPAVENTVLKKVKNLTETTERFLETETF